MKREGIFLILASLVFLAGCESSTEPGFDGRVQIRFRTLVGSPAVVSAAPGAQQLGVSAAPLAILGSNGTLTLEGVWLAVSEFELEGDDDACPEPTDDCNEFESGPFFAELPLDEEGVTVATGDVPPGLYHKLEFEVEDMDDDDEDDGKGASNLWSRARIQFPDWPAQASMLVRGSFAPAGGGASTSFDVYFDAEIEVEMTLNPPFSVDSESLQEVLVVNVAPDAWFLRPDGTVWDLSHFDYEQTGELLEFEFELENGFVSAEEED